MLLRERSVLVIDGRREPRGLLIDERASARGARAVRGKGLEVPPSVLVGKSVECGFLAAHADDPAGMWHQVHGAEQLGDGVVLVGDPEPRGTNLPVVAGECELIDPVGAKPFQDRSQYRECARHNPTEVPLVGVLVDQLALRVEDDTVDAYRANVDPYRVHTPVSVRVQ